MKSTFATRLTATLATAAAIATLSTTVLAAQHPAPSAATVRSTLQVAALKTAAVKLGKRSVDEIATGTLRLTSSHFGVERRGIPGLDQDEIVVKTLIIAWYGWGVPDDAV